MEMDNYASEYLMDEHVLSQDEMNSLLGDSSLQDPAPAGEAAESHARGWQERQLEGVQARYQGICQELAGELRQSLGTEVEVSVADLRLTTVGEFILGMEPPTCLNVMRAEPLQSPWFLEMESGALFPMIGRLLGGGPQGTTSIRRAATEIEMHLINQLTERFLVILQRAWAGILDCSFSLDRVESNPQRIEGLVPRDALVLIQMNIRFDSVEGRWCQGLPANALHSARAPLARGVLTGTEKLAPVEEPQVLTARSPIELRALLAQMRITPEDFASLSEGDVLRTPIEADEDFQIHLDGHPRFTARAGVMQGYKAIEIRQILDEEAASDQT
ncbi:MAG: FliM/FliN family flagellar motor switch protein [Planctomycetota bacterium]|nr:FliM/FliN family flagellar motor switch protein [Planctomycetota bacterium]